MSVSRSPDDLAVFPAAPADRRAVLELVLANLPDAVREVAFSSMAPSCEAQPWGLIGAWRAGRLVGAVWGELQPGRAAVVYPPQVVPSEPSATVAALLVAMEKELCRHGVRFMQLQVDELTGEQAAAYGAAGLKLAGWLLYLACDVHGGPFSPPSDIQFEAYRDDQQERLTAVIERTYEHSLDLPALDGLRGLGDVLEGYRKTGRYDPQSWSFVVHCGRDVGCVLLAEHPACQWELLYMGISPDSRGYGLGLATTQYALQRVRDAGGQRLLLAVDERNRPAVAAYGRAGFQPWRRSAVFFKGLNSQATS